MFKMSVVDEAFNEIDDERILIEILWTVRILNKISLCIPKTCETITLKGQ